MGVFYFGVGPIWGGAFLRRRRSQGAAKDLGSSTTLLSQALAKVRERLDVELLHIEECLPLMPALLQLKEEGVHIRITLPLERDPGFPKRAWDLEAYLSRGIDIRWGPTVSTGRLVADGRQTYRLEGEWIVQDPEMAKYPMTGSVGTIKIFSGEVLDRRRREPGLTQLDRLVFVHIWALGGRFPIFFSSGRTAVDSLAGGDCIKVLCVINWSGGGVFSAFAPTELYYEGVDFRPIACPEADA